MSRCHRRETPDEPSRGILKHLPSRFSRRAFIRRSAACTIAATSAVGCSPGLLVGPHSGSDGGSSTRDSGRASDQLASPPPDGAPDGVDQGPFPPLDGQADAADDADGALPLAGSVADILHPQVQQNQGKIDLGQAQAVLSAALAQLTGLGDPAKAWRLLIPDFSSDKRIGLKVNCINSSMANSPVFLQAVVQSLIGDLGATAQNITIWDRTSGELASAGITSNAVGVNVQGTDGNYGSAVTVAGLTTHVSDLQQVHTDLTINCGVLKDHNQSGITGALKNNYGSIDNPSSFHNQMATRMPALNKLGPFKDRTRIYFIEGFRAVATGGPGGSPTHAPGRLLLSVDPVAIDVQALAIINSLRTSPVDSSKLGWIDEAQAQGLGSKNPTIRQHTV